VTVSSLTGEATALCPAGTFAIGGGFDNTGTGVILSSGPVGGTPATGWQAAQSNADSITVYAVCSA
jgi:hypothetical protein